MKRFRQISITVVLVSLLFSAVAYADTWTPNKQITNTLGDSKYPAMAVDGTNIYVVWQDTPDLLNEEIYFKRSVDGGVTWKATRNLSNTTGDSYAPAIAVYGLNIYVVWQDYTLGNSEIYFKRSDDGGATWTTKRLTYNELGSMFPAIAVDGSNIYVVWQNPITVPMNWEIYFKKGVLF
jgi:Neuraminidase (sialidase)